MAQAGDAGGNAPGYTLPIEPNSLKHEPGSVALARSNVSGQITAQFYVNLRAQPSLDGRDTVFGRVVSGQSVLDQLTERNPEQSPTAPPGDRILSITVDEGPVS